VLWIMDCYPSRDDESTLDFKQRIGFFLEWALLRLATPATIPVRACLVIAGAHDDGWQHGFEAWSERFQRSHGDRRAMLGDLERRVAGLLDFWRRAQRDPPWYFPASSWAAASRSQAEVREKWAGSFGKMAERDYAPGYARLLAGDRDFSDESDFAALQTNAAHLRALIDLTGASGFTA